jgi:outer membrane protein
MRPDARRSLACAATIAAALALAHAALAPIARAAGGAPVPLSFEDALRRALAANLGLGRARAEVAVANAQRRGALSLVLPRLGATGGLIRNDQEVVFGGEGFSRVILPRNDWNLHLTLTQPIFAGLREQRAYQQAKEGVRFAEQGVRITEDRILLRTAQDYLTVVAGDELARVAEQTVALAQDRLKQAKDFFEAGETTRVDVLRAESAVKTAERQLTLARRDRDAAAGQLRIDLDLDLDGDFVVQEPAPSLPLRADEALLLQRAQETRGDVAQARSAQRVAELETSKQKGAYLPTITADAGYVWQKTAFPTDKYGYAAVRFSVPIWQSGEIGSRVAVASERERQARLSLAEAVRTAQEDVRRALLDLGTAQTALVLSQEQLQAAEAEYAQVSDLYRSEEATSLDIQSSEANLADARRAVVVSRIGRLIAELGVQFAAGDLKSAVLKEAQP